MARALGWIIETMEWRRFRADIHAGKGFVLLWSSHNGHLDVVKFLVDCGAAIHAEDNKAVKHSALNGKLEVFMYLIEKCESITADKAFNIFKRALIGGILDIVKYLIERGVNIHAKHE